jgi:hypothetical protein
MLVQGVQRMEREKLIGSSSAVCVRLYAALSDRTVLLVAANPMNLWASGCRPANAGVV